MSNASPSGEARGRRGWPTPTSNSIALPAGTVCPWSSTSCGDVAADVRRGRLVAQELLDRVRDSDAVVDQLAALVGVLGEHLAGPADQPGRGLVAGAGDHGDVGEELVAA